MQFMNIMKVLLLGLVLVWVSGCSSTGGGAKDTDQQSAAESEAAQAEAYKAQREAELAAQSMDAERAAAEEQERLVSITTFYFDFDQSVVKPEAQAALEAHAKNLVASGGNVVLEGHADERGTREYNLALGERRAEAISQYLTVLGVSSQQIETVSYGEERPASRGHDDSSWSLNRRVELRYGN